MPPVPSQTSRSAEELGVNKQGLRPARTRCPALPMSHWAAWPLQTGPWGKWQRTRPRCASQSREHTPLSAHKTGGQWGLEMGSWLDGHSPGTWLHLHLEVPAREHRAQDSELSGLTAGCTQRSAGNGRGPTPATAPLRGRGCSRPGVQLGGHQRCPWRTPTASPGSAGRRHGTPPGAGSRRLSKPLAWARDVGGEEDEEGPLTPIPRAGLAAGLHAQEDPSTRTGHSRPAACPLSPGVASDRQCVSTVSGSTVGLGRCTPTPRCPVATHTS